MIFELPQHIGSTLSSSGCLWSTCIWTRLTSKIIRQARHAHRHAQTYLHTTMFIHFQKSTFAWRTTFCLHYPLKNIVTSPVTSHSELDSPGLPSSTPWTIFSVTKTTSRTMRHDGPKVAKWRWTSWRGTSSTRPLAPVFQLYLQDGNGFFSANMPGRWNGW